MTTRYGLRGRHTRDVNARDHATAIAEAAQHPGLEVVASVDGGPWQPAPAEQPVVAR